MVQKGNGFAARFGVRSLRADVWGGYGINAMFNGLVLRDFLQETIDFPIKIMGLSCKISLKPIQ